MSNNPTSQSLNVLSIKHPIIKSNVRPTKAQKFFQQTAVLPKSLKDDMMLSINNPEKEGRPSKPVSVEVETPDENDPFFQIGRVTNRIGNLVSNYEEQTEQDHYAMLQELDSNFQINNYDPKEILDESRKAVDGLMDKAKVLKETQFGMLGDLSDWFSREEKSLKDADITSNVTYDTTVPVSTEDLLNVLQSSAGTSQERVSKAIALHGDIVSHAFFAIHELQRKNQEQSLLISDLKRQISEHSSKRIRKQQSQQLRPDSSDSYRRLQEALIRINTQKVTIKRLNERIEQLVGESVINSRIEEPPGKEETQSVTKTHDILSMEMQIANQKNEINLLNDQVFKLKHDNQIILAEKTFLESQTLSFQEKIELEQTRYDALQRQLLEMINEKQDSKSGESEEKKKELNLMAKIIELQEEIQKLNEKILIERKNSHEEAENRIKEMKKDFEIRELELKKRQINEAMNESQQSYFEAIQSQHADELSLMKKNCEETIEMMKKKFENDKNLMEQNFNEKIKEFQSQLKKGLSANDGLDVSKLIESMQKQNDEKIIDIKKAFTDKIDSQREDFQKHLNSLENEIKNKDIEIIKLTSELVELRDITEQKESAPENPIQDDSDFELKRLKLKVIDYQNKLKEMTESLQSEKDTAVEVVRTELLDQVNKSKELKNENKKLQCELNLLKDQLKKSDNDSSLADLTDSFARQTAELNDVKEQLDEVKAKLAASEKKLFELNKANVELKNDKFSSESKEFDFVYNEQFSSNEPLPVATRQKVQLSDLFCCLDLPYEKPIQSSKVIINEGQTNEVNLELSSMISFSEESQNSPALSLSSFDVAALPPKSVNKLSLAFPMKITIEEMTDEEVVIMKEKQSARIAMTPEQREDSPDGSFLPVSQLVIQSSDTLFVDLSSAAPSFLNVAVQVETENRSKIDRPVLSHQQPLEIFSVDETKEVRPEEPIVLSPSEEVREIKLNEDSERPKGRMILLTESADLIDIPLISEVDSSTNIEAANAISKMVMQETADISHKLQLVVSEIQSIDQEPDPAKRVQMQETLGVELDVEKDSLISQMRERITELEQMMKRVVREPETPNKNETSNAETEVVNIGIETDNVETEAVNAGTETSNDGTKAANVGAEAVNTGTETSNVETEAVNTRIEAVNAGTETSNVETEAVNTGTEAVNSGTETSNVGTEAVNARTETTNVGTETVNVETETINVGTEVKPSSGIPNDSVEFSTSSTQTDQVELENVGTTSTDFSTPYDLADNQVKKISLSQSFPIVNEQEVSISPNLELGISSPSQMVDVDFPATVDLSTEYGVQFFHISPYSQRSQSDDGSEVTPIELKISGKIECDYGFNQALTQTKTNEQFLLTPQIVVADKDEHKKLEFRGTSPLKPNYVDVGISTLAENAKEDEKAKKKASKVVRVNMDSIPAAAVKVSPEPPKLNLITNTLLVVKPVSLKGDLKLAQIQHQAEQISNLKKQILQLQFSTSKNAPHILSQVNSTMNLINEDIKSIEGNGVIIKSQGPKTSRDSYKSLNLSLVQKSDINQETTAHLREAIETSTGIVNTIYKDQSSLINCQNTLFNRINETTNKFLNEMGKPGGATTESQSKFLRQMNEIATEFSDTLSVLQETINNDENVKITLQNAKDQLNDQEKYIESLKKEILDLKLGVGKTRFVQQLSDIKDELTNILEEKEEENQMIKTFNDAQKIIPKIIAKGRNENISRQAGAVVVLDRISALTKEITEKSSKDDWIKILDLLKEAIEILEEHDGKIKARKIIDQLNAQIKALQSEITKMQSELVIAQRDLQLCEDKNGMQIKALQKSLDTSKDHSNMLEKQLEIMKNSLMSNNKDAKFKSLENQIEIMRHNEKQQKEELDNLMNKNNELNNENKKLVEELTKIKEMYSTLFNQCSDTQTSNESLKSKTEEIFQEAEIAKQKCAALEKMRLSASLQADDLAQQLSTLVGENAQLQNLLVKAQQKQRELENSLLPKPTNIVENNESLCVENSSSNNRVIRIYQQRIEDFMNLLSKNGNDLVDLRSRHATDQKNLIMIQRELKRNQNDFKINQLRYDCVKKENALLTNTLANRDETIRMLKREIERLRSLLKVSGPLKQKITLFEKEKNDVEIEFINKKKEMKNIKKQKEKIQIKNPQISSYFDGILERQQATLARIEKRRKDLREIEEKNRIETLRAVSHVVNMAELQIPEEVIFNLMPKPKPVQKLQQRSLMIQEQKRRNMIENESLMADINQFQELSEEEPTQFSKLNSYASSFVSNNELLEKPAIGPKNSSNLNRLSQPQYAKQPSYADTLQMIGSLAGQKSPRTLQEMLRNSRHNKILLPVQPAPLSKKNDTKSILSIKPMRK